MKTKSLLAVSLILALGFTSCSNSLDEDYPASGKDNNVLVVKLPANVKLTRSVEKPVDNASETGVSDITVFLLIGQLVERAVEFSQSDIDAGYKRFEQVPAQVDGAIVVANRAGQSILGLKNADQIRNYAFTVATQHTDKELDGRTLMGEAVATQTSDPSQTPDGHIYKEAKVTLSAITARIEVGTVIPGEGVQAVELVAVYINNFYSTYPKIDLTLYAEGNAIWNPTVTGVNPGANKGSKDPIGEIVPGAYTPAEYMTPGSTEVKQTADSKVYAFHVFPGNVPHLVMLVKVELKKDYFEVDDDGNELKYKYGFLTFNKFKTASNDYVQEMVGHNIYKMGVGTKGIPVNAKDVTDKPEKGPYDLGVNIDIAEWTVNEVTPEV